MKNDIVKVVVFDLWPDQQAWAKRLRGHPSIKKCVHYVASHEVRAAFPLDSVQYQGA
jgi:hypothetical protein